MTATMVLETAREAAAARLNPALTSLEENVRQAHRAITHGRYAAEDFGAATILRVRRHPVSALALAATAGALTGCMLGFALGWQTRGRTSG
jgi:ElaB/YqjD/DUF883 family membrane-anchored ribosome-binding protein